MNFELKKISKFSTKKYILKIVEENFNCEDVLIKKE